MAIFMNTLLLVAFSCLLFIGGFATEDESSAENIHTKTALPSEAICENRVSAFFVTDNARLVSSNSLTYEDVSEEDCLRMCSENRDNKGRSILCASFTYDHVLFTCTVYRSKSMPDGELEREQAAGKRSFEKFCIEEDLPVECADTQFLRADQSVIIGYAKNVSIVESLEECAAQCLREQFQCKSAMYFYEEGECITNTESALSKPTSFAREESDKVIYFQNGCSIVLERQKLLDAATDTAKSKPKKKKTAAKKARNNNRIASAGPTADYDEANTETFEAATEAIETTTIEADQVILTEDEQKNAEQVMAEIEEKLRVASQLEKSEHKQNHEVKKTDEEEININGKAKIGKNEVKVNRKENKNGVQVSKKEKIRRIKISAREEAKGEAEMSGKETTEEEVETSGNDRREQLELSGRERQAFNTESTTEANESTTAQESDKEPKEEETERKKKSKNQKIGSENDTDIESESRDNIKEEKQEEAEDSDYKKEESLSSAENCGHKGEQTVTKTVEEKQTAKKYSNHPRALSVTDRQHKKSSHGKSVSITSKAGSQTSRKAHSKSVKIVQVDPATISAEQRREEIETNEVIVQRKSKARGVKSSKKLKIKTTSNPDEETSGYFSLWSEWTPCLSSGERKVRRRKCLDLRKCVGALMEVDKCPEDVSREHDNLSQVQTIVSAGPVGPERSISTGIRHANQPALPPSILPSNVPSKKKSHPHSTTIHNASDDIWSPWLGVCQEFASGQPCKNHEVIGFESRECVAKDPATCVGPFFRYCTLPC